MPAPTHPEAVGAEHPRAPRRFEFGRDSFAFANELHWEYHFDSTTGKTTFSQCQPKPTYAHRCFVLVRSARQFLYHARFAPGLDRHAEPENYRRAIREVMSRSPRGSCAPGEPVVFPGFAHLHEFSQAHEALLKAECGGAWQSYVLRSHWRMVFPISRAHQGRTAASLLAEIRRGRSPIIHLVLFPKLTINHGMMLFEAVEAADRISFAAYDPNQPERPTEVSFERATQTFFLAANRYWAGGPLDVIEIYRNAWM